MKYKIEELGNICNVKRGTTITFKQTSPGKIPVVGGGLKPTYYHNKKNREGNVITVSGSGANAGYVNFYKNPIFASDCSTIEAKNNKINIKYVFRAIQAQQSYIYNKLKSGAAQPHVYAKDLIKLKIKLPDLKDQEKICNKLDLAEKLNLRRKKSKEILELLKISIFFEKFGDPISNLKKISTKKIKELCKLINGLAFKPSDWEENGLPIIRIQNLNDENKKYNYTSKKFDQKYLVKKDDILLSWSGTPGTSFGCFKWKKQNGWLNQHIFKVHVNEKFIDKDFFLLQMNLKIDELILKSHGGVGLKHVKKSMIDDIEMMIPPISNQINFIKLINKIDHTISKNNIAKKNQDKLFFSIQNLIFNSNINEKNN